MWVYTILKATNIHLLYVNDFLATFVEHNSSFIQRFFQVMYIYD